jgi:hypothetical protein
LYTIWYDALLFFWIKWAFLFQLCLGIVIISFWAVYKCPKNWATKKRDRSFQKCAREFIELFLHIKQFKQVQIEKDDEGVPFFSEEHYHSDRFLKSELIQQLAVKLPIICLQTLIYYEERGRLGRYGFGPRLGMILKSLVVFVYGVYNFRKHFSRFHYNLFGKYTVVYWGQGGGDHAPHTWRLNSN